MMVICRFQTNNLKEKTRDERAKRSKSDTVLLFGKLRPASGTKASLNTKVSMTEVSSSEGTYTGVMYTKGTCTNISYTNVTYTNVTYTDVTSLK